MVSRIVLNIILVLQVLTTLVMYTTPLPITSKPIESTAENLAWQAWLMLPPEQKSLEKSRKVTPKSIFTLPFRECPPGHHLFENRCIPTVQIDQTELIKQELLGFVDGLIGGSDNNYEEFDYDDLGGDVMAEVLYEPAQKLNGHDERSVLNDTTYDQLPSQDEPLKFNIFQQKFPTDYDSIATPSEEPKKQQSTTIAANSNNSTNTTIAEAVNALAMAAPKQNASDANVDLQMESSNVSANIAEKAHDIVAPTTAFLISDIDAIAWPAKTVQKSKNDGNDDADADADYLEIEKQNIHKFSLFKDDSSVQLVTSSLLADHNNKENSKQPDFTQLLKADNLLPLPNVAATAAKKTTITTTDTMVTTAQTSGNTDNEVPTLSTPFATSSSNVVSTTTLLSSSASSSADNDEVTELMVSDVDATIPTIAKEIDYKKPNFIKKAEHPRSVIDDLEAQEAQEENFETTTETDVTTNFQLDETTIVEAHDAQSIALKELLELASPTHTSGGLGIVKKSKVELVELPPIIKTETDLTSMPTAVITTEKTKNTMNASKVSAPSVQPTTMLTTPTATATTTPSLLASTTATTSTKTTDRFNNYQQQKLSTKTGEQHNNDDKENDKLNFRNTETTPTTTKMTAKTSEIDIEQELRMINESVKGNENSNNYNNNNNTNVNEKNINEQQHQQQLNAVAMKSATVEAESGPATTTISALTSDTNLNATEESSEATTTAFIPASPTQHLATATTTTTESSTSTIWSKIMPLLGFGGDSTTFATVETTKSAAITTTTPKSLSSTISATDPTKSPINTNFSTNRSNRNSKIIRINSLSSFSSSTNSKAHITSSSSSSVISKQNADKLALSSPQSSQIVTTTTTTQTPTPTSTSTTTTEIVEISADTSTSSSGFNIDDGIDYKSTATDSDGDGDSGSDGTSESNQGEPFWWLPIGWRLDQANEPSLLLRLWSALPGQGE